MDPMRREHTIGSSMSDNLRPQFARGRAFKNAEAASDETAKIRALSISIGIFFLLFDLRISFALFYKF